MNASVCIAAFQEGLKVRMKLSAFPFEPVGGWSTGACDLYNQAMTLTTFFEM
jgi:hypothetical protein